MSDQVENQDESPKQPAPTMHRQVVQKPNVTEQVVPAVPAATESSKLERFLEMFAAKELREMESIEALEAGRKVRNAQRELSAKTHIEKILVKQARCGHKKGGKKGPRNGVIDYNVFIHTYINGENVIKCHTCGMKWKVNDTIEFLVRGSRQIANHTKIGWAQASAFLSQTTNAPSSSEVPMKATPTAAFAGTEVD